MRRLTAIIGALCVFGAAGTDQRMIEAGQVPPETTLVVYAIGLALLVVCLIWRKKSNGKIR